MAEDLEDPFATEEAAPAPAPAPKKKSLFAKSTWNKPAKPVEQKEGIGFFSRAEEMWPSRVAEEEKKRQKKLVKLERKRSTVSAERKHSDSPTGKRRRLSQKEEPERHSSEGSINHEDPDEASWTRRESTLSTPGSRKSQTSTRAKSHGSPTSLAERYSRDLETKNKESRSEMAEKGVISLIDSGDDEDEDIILVAPKLAARVEEDPDVSDEEFPELAREARQREQKKALERLELGRSFENKNRASNGSNTPDHAIDDIFQERPAASEDPRVEIFVSSVIEGTNPLVVRRKLSQIVREVRTAWCDKQSISGQPFSKDIKDSIFLTWKGRKLFDYTSCKSLSLKIDGTGQFYSDSEGVMDGRIHFEAWTQELFDHNERRLAAKKHCGASEDEPEEVKEIVEEIRITLTARGRKDLKLKVKSSTPLQKLLDAFCKLEHIPEDQNVTLHFDGEVLDPEKRVGDTEIADRDSVEIHIR